jgi:hypothetical protein
LRLSARKSLRGKGAKNHVRRSGLALFSEAKKFIFNARRRTTFNFPAELLAWLPRLDYNMQATSASC